MFVLAFDQALASRSAEEFVDLLVGEWGVAGVVTGEDFTFGRGRAGNADILRRLCAERGVEAEIVPPVAADGEIISSSRIREALMAGDCATATQLLSRPFAIEGAIIDGDKRGATIGFPTANMELGHYLRPRYGIYAVEVRLPDGRIAGGAANLGIRPSFDPPRELLETFIFDFEGDLYGQTIEVALIAWLRAEAVFDRLSALVAQMDEDVARARQILAAGPASPRGAG